MYMKSAEEVRPLIITTEDLDARVQQRRRIERRTLKRHAEYLRRGLVAGVLAGSIVVASVKTKTEEAPRWALRGLTRIEAVALQGLVNTIAPDESRDEQMVYSGHYKIPTPNQIYPYRVVKIGEVENVPVLGGEERATLSTISDVARYVNAENPQISIYEVVDLIRAENSQDQRKEGIPEDKIDPNWVRPDQDILLPLDYGSGIGEVINPAAERLRHEH
jgi:hypothetical protein